MDIKIRKVFLAIFSASAIPFAILFLTDCLIRTSRKK